MVQMFELTKGIYSQLYPILQCFWEYQSFHDIDLDVN